MDIDPSVVEQIFKLKQAGWTDQKIAHRLGLTASSIPLIIQEVMRMNSVEEGSGHGFMLGDLTVLSNAYQTVGIILKHFALSVDQQPSIEEIKEVLKGDPETAAIRLKTSFLIFRQYQPCEEVSKTLEDQAGKN
jgi:hypothetical protein